MAYAHTSRKRSTIATLGVYEYMYVRPLMILPMNFLLKSVNAFTFSTSSFSMPWIRLKYDEAHVGRLVDVVHDCLRVLGGLTATPRLVEELHLLELIGWRHQVVKWFHGQRRLNDDAVLAVSVE